ncbi:MAG: hypothetical protein ABFR97_10875 [Thermodesulfobacteriota bacterium]
MVKVTAIKAEAWGPVKIFFPSCLTIQRPLLSRARQALSTPFTGTIAALQTIDLLLIAHKLPQSQASLTRLTGKEAIFLAL